MSILKVDNGEEKIREGKKLKLEAGRAVDKTGKTSVICQRWARN